MRRIYRLIIGVVCLTAIGLAGCSESKPTSRCAGKDCNDQIDCTADSCDAVTGDCVHNPDDSLCAAGEVCNADTGCVAAPCEQDGDCDDGLYCNGSESCVNGACSAGAFPCDDGVACTTDSCDEDADSCANTPDDSQCDPGEVCDPVAGCQAQVECTSDQDCDDGLFCNGAETCQNESCLPGAAVSCGDSVACTLDSCDEDSAACQNLPDHGACPAGEVCDPAQGCVAATCNADADCDDGFFCNGAETCQVDTCVAGVVVLCDDSIDCTEDACNEVSDQCEFLPVDGLCGLGEVCDPAQGGCVTAPCTGDADCDDGLYCNGAETCQAPDCVAGTPVDCDDSVGCTVDSCDENNDVCDNLADHGQCPAGEICDVLQGCVGVPCTADSDCDDGLYCNGTETCQGQNCASGTPPDCADPVTCTQDSCDETNDVCLNTPDDTACDDGQYCTGAETCDALLDCQDGADPDCADLVGCTFDSCDEIDDLCLHTPDDTDCDDGLYCNGAETCDALLDCQAGADPCDDLVGCTADSCDDTNDLCLHVPDDAACDDGLYCTGAETCDELLDCQDGADPDCADAVPCTSDNCDEVNDGCLNPPDDGACDDSVYCNGAETCDALLGCQDGTAVDCVDASECTLDLCDEVNDQCDNSPLAFGSPCAGMDGNYCTSSCNFAGSCNNFIAVDCSDGVECTDEVCDPTDGSCTNPPLAAGVPCAGADSDYCTSSCDGSGACDDFTAPTCDDGLYCNGAEICVAAFGCLAGPDPCDDSVGCTQDSCDEGTSICTNTADDALCDDSLYCTGVETCDPVSGCLAGTPIECTGSGACLMGVCSELLQDCEDQPEDLDGDGHQPVACGGDDCDDTNPNSYPGATEICDGDDNDCDTEIDEGFGAYRDPCLTDADCCSNNCVNDICDFPAGACRPPFSVCSVDGDCCSNQCGPDIAGVLRCQSDAICGSEGSPCTRATDCCSMYCVGGACATGGLCVPDGGVCTVNEDCCGSFCDAGTCDANAGSCFPLGETCSSPGNCCSNVCIEIQPGESRCNYHSECYDEGEHCIDDSDCCNCLCEADGFCGSPGACSTAYESCGGWGECCSRLCVIEPSGTGVCRFISGCLSEGELCDPTCIRTCASCCSGECETKATGGLTTSRCTKGGFCLPAGHVCGGTGTANCCDGGSDQCRMTRTGITRCFGAAYPGDCLAGNSPCAFSDQCCSGYCLPDTAGDLFCSPACSGLGEACTASADCCVDPVILKCEDCACVESDRDCVDIGNPCETTGECCYGVCDDDGGTDFFCVLN